MIKFLVGLLEHLVGDCGTCKHEDDCPYIKAGNGSCFEIGGFEPHYEKRKKVINNGSIKTKNDK